MKRLFRNIRIAIVLSPLLVSCGPQLERAKTAVDQARPVLSKTEVLCKGIETHGDPDDQRVVDALTLCEAQANAELISAALAGRVACEEVYPRSE